MVVRPLVAREVEQLVLQDRPAQGSAELVVDQLRVSLVDRCEVRPGLERIVAVVLEGRTVQVVGSALDLHVHRGAAREPLLGIEAVGDDVDGVDRFERRNVGRHVRQPDVGSGHTVDADVIRASAGSVDVEGQGARWIRGNRVRVFRHAEAGEGLEQALVVPPHRDRQILQCLRVQLRFHLGPVGLQGHGLSRYRDRFGYLSDLQRNIDAGHGIQGHVNVGLQELFETRKRNLHGVASGLDGRQAVITQFIRDAFAGLIGRFVRDRHAGARDRASAGILHVAND